MIFGAGFHEGASLRLRCRASFRSYGHIGKTNGKPQGFIPETIVAHAFPSYTQYQYHLSYRYSCETHHIAYRTPCTISTKTSIYPLF